MTANCADCANTTQLPPISFASGTAIIYAEPPIRSLNHERCHRSTERLAINRRCATNRHFHKLHRLRHSMFRDAKKLQLSTRLSITRPLVTPGDTGRSPLETFHKSDTERLIDKSGRESNCTLEEPFSKAEGIKREKEEEAGDVQTQAKYSLPTNERYVDVISRRRIASHRVAYARVTGRSRSSKNFTASRVCTSAVNRAENQEEGEERWRNPV